MALDHFSYQATFITDSAKFRDREFLLQKTKWLAKSFFSDGFDEKYVFCIENKFYKLEDQKNNDYLHYTIINPDTSLTNYIYEGWTFEKAGNRTRIHLMGYLN